MRYTYYPGCSLRGTGNDYEQSLVAVFRALGHELTELPDWNCCGFISYMSIDQAQALLLAARNLGLAEKEGIETLIAPCTACQVVLKRVDDFRHRYPALMGQVLGALHNWGLDYHGGVRVRHPLDVLYEDIGVDQITRRVQRELRGLRVAPYYGCLYDRPYGVTEERFFPAKMEELFRALGVDVIDFHLRTKCCGGSLTSTVEDVGLRAVYILLHEAKRLGADMLATTCPLCQFNLESTQGRVGSRFGEDVRIRVLYFTQLLGLLLGLPEKELGLHKHVATVPKEMVPA